MTHVSYQRACEGSETFILRSQIGAGEAYYSPGALLIAHLNGLTHAVLAKKYAARLCKLER
jgi:hypothetical protein